MRKKLSEYFENKIEINISSFQNDSIPWSVMAPSIKVFISLSSNSNFSDNQFLKLLLIGND